MSQIPPTKSSLLSKFILGPVSGEKNAKKNYPGILFCENPRELPKKGKKQKSQISTKLIKKYFGPHTSES